jgi:hypothetical protein
MPSYGWPSIAYAYLSTLEVQTDTAHVHIELLP